MSYKYTHALAQQFAVRAGCDGVVLLTADYKSAISNYPDTAVVFLLQTSKTKLNKEQQDGLPKNVAVLPLRYATTDVLKNKVFVCVDYLEGSSRAFGLLGRRTLSSLAEKSALSIIATAKSPRWTAARFKKSLKLNKTALYGQYQEKELVAIGGHLTKVFGSRYPLVPVLAVISQFNEVDIIEPVVNHLVNQGIDVHVIDNWSNDGSYEAVGALAEKNRGRITFERFPKHDTRKYEWTKILERVTEVAKERPHYKWVISNDADEIRWSPWPGVSLQKAISFIDYKGFNIIDYTVFNFSPTKDGYRRGMNPLGHFGYGDFGHEGWHFMQLKTWRNNPAANIASSGGHLVDIPDPKIFPLKFLIGHYPLRSNEQAAKKIFQDRKPRFHANERKKGWHSHYDKINGRQSFIVKPDGLIDLSKQQSYRDHLVELASGIGIKVNKIKKT